MMGGGRAAAPRHRLARQELARHARRARPARHRREARRRSRPPALQGRRALAARAGRRQPLRRGAARRSSSSRRSARWSRRRSRSSSTAAPTRRWWSARRTRRTACSCRPGARSTPTRSPSSSARRILRYADDVGDRRAAEAARACAGDAGDDRGRRRARRRISAPAARTTPRPSCRKEAAPMPASAATTWRSGWTARTEGFTQMGGEGANWVGEAPFSNARPRLPESRRRHLQPFRHARHPRRGRGRRQHHLQDPLQRRRRDDRRPAGRRAT